MDYNWGEAGKGAAGGAMSGAAMGSVAGPWGTVIGGVAGGLIGGGMGLFSGDDAGDYEARLKKLSEGYGDRQRQMGPAAQGSFSQFRSNQAGLIAQLEAMARGQGPSAATMQMREAMDRAAGAQSGAHQRRHGGQELGLQSRLRRSDQARQDLVLHRISIVGHRTVRAGRLLQLRAAGLDA